MKLNKLSYASSLSAKSGWGTYLIELGYEIYTTAHNGKTTQGLLNQLEPEATWTQVGVRTPAIELSPAQPFGACPYPVRLTLLRWQAGETIKQTTMVSFSDAEPLPITAVFPTYHQRQDVEAGIKQGKSTFGLTKLRVRSAAGLWLLEQFALVFWPNFIHWAATWLMNQVHDDNERFSQLLQQVRPQVRVAAQTPAWVLTNPDGQMLNLTRMALWPGSPSIWMVLSLTNVPCLCSRPGSNSGQFHLYLLKNV